MRRLSAISSDAERARIKWPVAAGVAVYHALAALAFTPWFFSWAGVAVCVLSHYVFGVLGINLAYHRLLTHRGFRCPKWLERTLVLLGVCALQEAPAYWVGVHRRHHQFSDHEPDPHTPMVSFLWAHAGWVFVERPGEERNVVATRYAGDVLRDPLYVWLQRRGWHLVVWISWGVFFLGGWAAAAAAGASGAQAIRFGASMALWGIAVRTVLGWHLTWLVNSVTHRWGYRNYATDDESRNHFVIALLTSGEGWHNNHHADPRSARHGHRWWELDVSWLIIRLLAALGLATHVVGPSRHMSADSSK